MQLVRMPNLVTTIRNFKLLVESAAEEGAAGGARGKAEGTARGARDCVLQLLEQERDLLLEELKELQMFRLL